MTPEDRTFITTLTLPVLGPGSRGANVEKLQALLNAVADAGLAEDAVFGPRTEQAVRAFQTSADIGVDGIVGRRTWTALLSVDAPLPDVVVRQPLPFDIVGDFVRVCGLGRGFEGNVVIRVLDANGTEIASTAVIAGAVALAEFDAQLPLGGVPATIQGRLVATNADGPGLVEVRVPITFGPALIAPYQGFDQRTVQPGDTLSAIAREVYGNTSLFRRIFEANRNQLADPNRIRPGQVLRIPR